MIVSNNTRSVRLQDQYMNTRLVASFYQDLPQLYENIRLSIENVCFWNIFENGLAKNKKSKPDR